MFSPTISEPPERTMILRPERMMATLWRASTPATNCRCPESTSMGDAGETSTANWLEWNSPMTAMRTCSDGDAAAPPGITNRATSSRAAMAGLHRTLWLQVAQHVGGQHRSLCSRHAVLPHHQNIAGKVGWPCDNHKAVCGGVSLMGTDRRAGFRQEALVQALPCQAGGGSVLG